MLTIQCALTIKTDVVNLRLGGLEAGNMVEGTQYTPISSHDLHAHKMWWH